MPKKSHSEHIRHNIDAVANLHARTERKVGRAQRYVETLTVWIGRPQFFFGILVGVAFWVLANLLARHLGVRPWDRPPFSNLQGVIGLSAMLITVMILITQNRQGEITQRLEHLDLQMSLLTEQKAAKIIELLEEMRRDSPTLKDRVDPVANSMQQTADPHAVLTAIEYRLENAMAGATEAEQSVILASEDALKALDLDDQAR